MDSGLASTSIFTAFFVIITIPSLRYIYNQYTNSNSSSKPDPNRFLRALINLSLLFHTIWILKSLVLRSPVNIFKELGVEWTAPVDVLKAVVMQKASSEDGGGEVPDYLNLLVKRLGSFEMRNLYIRFGHDAIASCEHCSKFEDYALFALAPVLLSYVFEALLIGIITLKNSHRESLRTHALGVLVCAGVLETYYRLTESVVLPQRGSNETVYMWHNNLTFYRHILFLLLPLIITSPLPLLLPPRFSPFPFIPSPTPTNPNHMVPAPSLPDPSLSIQTTLNALNATMTRLHLLKYTHAALMRVPELRTQAGEWWEKEKREGDWIRGDEEVRRVARGVGLPYENKEEVNEMLDEEGVVRPQGDGQKVVVDGVEIPEEGGLRTSARQAVGTLKMAYVPSQYW
ncbi:hypothetical protein BDN72DRAFT_795923 [Pluteus cervinus]|uniref:Uncharacterized protein n=1 Tax=Pluteus cervinus TaxID=181527 RepID=A0ACD3AWF1_9AGAR|nr:hypothetical protein BDN72DRAFT_795923 [Pluteus cervinus]